MYTYLFKYDEHVLEHDGAGEADALNNDARDASSTKHEPQRQACDETKQPTRVVNDVCRYIYIYVSSIRQKR